VFNSRIKLSNSLLISLISIPVIIGFIVFKKKGNK